MILRGRLSAPLLRPAVLLLVVAVALLASARPEARHTAVSSAAGDREAFVSALTTDTVLYGLNFSPYLDGQSPNSNSQISAAQIRARLTVIAPYITWVRTFGSTDGLEQVPSIAREFGLKVAAQAWIGPDETQNAQELANLIANITAGSVDLAIVGSEVLLRGDVSEAKLLSYIQQVRQAAPIGVRVATADTFDVLLAHPAVIAASDIVLPNIYPYWQGVPVSNAICELAAAYNQIIAAADAKPIIIAETGWPSGGNAVGAAVPSPENASSYFRQFVSWAKAGQVSYFYFAAFDEAWKTVPEGPQGAHWGIWDAQAVLKSGMQQILDGQTVPIDCSSTPGGPGTPDLHFTYVPSYGSGAEERLQGAALHVPTTDHKVVVYIRVGSGWWVKPTSGQPLTRIQRDGHWSAAIVTGGNDAIAQQIAAFLIPNTYSPPVLLGASSLPPELFANAIATAEVTRTVNSVSGHITDTLGQPRPGITVVISGSNNGSTTTAPDGKYSFPTLAASGPHTITAFFPRYVFTPPSHTFPAINGHVSADFVGSPSSNLLFRHATSGELIWWRMSGWTRSAHVTPSPNRVGVNWRVAGLGDFDADLQFDILWQEESTGDLFVWFLDPTGNGFVRLSYGYLSIARPNDPLWKVVSVADMNGDRKPDLVWQHASSGALAAWYLDGTVVIDRVSLNPWVVLDPRWKVVATGDFNSDGKTDLLWKHAVDGSLIAWLMDGINRSAVAWLTPHQLLDPHWQVAGVADLNGDSKPDLLFQHPDGRLAAWLMDGVVRIRAEMLNPSFVADPNWKISGAR